MIGYDWQIPVVATLAVLVWSVAGVLWWRSRPPAASAGATLKYADELHAMAVEAQTEDASGVPHELLVLADNDERRIEAERDARWEAEMAAFRERIDAHLETFRERWERETEPHMRHFDVALNRATKRLNKLNPIVGIGTWRRPPPLTAGVTSFDQVRYRAGIFALPARPVDWSTAEYPAVPVAAGRTAS